MSEFTGHVVGDRSAWWTEKGINKVEERQPQEMGRASHIAAAEGGMCQQHGSQLPTKPATDGFLTVSTIFGQFTIFGRFLAVA